MHSSAQTHPVAPHASACLASADRELSEGSGAERTQLFVRRDDLLESSVMKLRRLAPEYLTRQGGGEGLHSHQPRSVTLLAAVCGDGAWGALGGAHGGRGRACSEQAMVAETEKPESVTGEGPNSTGT